MSGRGIKEAQRAYSANEAGGPAFDADTAISFDSSNWRDSNGSVREQFSREGDPLDILIAREEGLMEHDDSSMDLSDAVISGDRDIGVEEDSQHASIADMHEEHAPAEEGEVSSRDVEAVQYEVQEGLELVQERDDWYFDYNPYVVRGLSEKPRGHRAGRTPISDRQRAELDARRSKEPQED